MKRFMLVLFLSIFAVPATWAQFGGMLSGNISDPSGSVVPKVKLQLRNIATNVVQTTESDDRGFYHFNGLAPATYELVADAKGFSEAQSTLTLETNQALAFDFQLTVGGSTQKVEVTTQAPAVDTGDTRLQETLTTSALSTLPLAGRSLISLEVLVPGVTGLGVTSNGSPGSGRDNYSTETQVDASANGLGSVSNMYVLDGMDVDSDARPGVLNMTPNPDAIQETSIQTNTYNVDYGRASSMLMAMTSKAGTSSYHGNASDYYTNQKLFAGTEFTHKYTPFHSDNISATIGGPVIPHKNFFFFFAIEPLRGSAGISSNVSFEDPQFTQWAETNFPNTVGTQLLKTYPVSNKVTGATVATTAATTFPTTCGTAATAFLPCSLPLVDSGNYSDVAVRNGTQYSLRLDKPFKSDRLYGTFFRTTLNTNNANPRAAFATPNAYFQYTLQVNETHTFNANTVNQASFGTMRDEGIQEETGPFSVPVVNVVGVGQGFGAGFAHGDFIQKQDHWRDVLTHVYKSHDISVGYEGYFANDVELFGRAYDQPNFSFNSLLDLAEDNPFTESNVAYNPLSGQQVLWDWNAAGFAHGLFVQDNWRIGRRVTLNYGLRWDDYGNPYSRDQNSVFANFFFGPGQSQQDQIANGSLIAHKRSFNRAVDDIFSPRLGIAWDITGSSKWLMRAGFGVYHNWPTLAITEEEYRGNPPGPIYPTFYAGQTPGPIFGLGTSNTVPYGFTYPSLPARALDPNGGIQGLQFNVGAIDPNLTPPTAYVYSGSLEHEIVHNVVASVAYTGSAGRGLFSGGNNFGGDVYGQDINELPDDLIIHNSLVPQRLNHSFGQIIYEQTNRVSNYNAFIASVRGQFHNGMFFTASYTRSKSEDDLGGSQGSLAFPSYINPHQWYGPSLWDIPNRFSLAWTYQLPSVNGGSGALGRVVSGWQITGTAILQSGAPFTVYTNSPFIPLTNSAGTFTGYAPGSGDYNADGDNIDYPDANSYQYATSRSAYLNGIFTPQSFSAPSTFGAEGNEKYDAFRGPGFEQWDAALLKNTKLNERFNLQVRLEVFNLFNRANLTAMDSNLPDPTFGKATGQLTPRFFQIGANLTF